MHHIRLMIIPITLVILIPLGLDFLLPAIPDITQDFQIDNETAQLTTHIFFIALGLGQLPLGMISDRYGRRFSALLGLGLFLGASLIGYFTTTTGIFLLIRFIQGLGAALVILTGFAVVRDSFEERDIPTKFSWLMAALNVASTFATIISAGLLTYWGWRSIFMIYSVIALAMMLLVFLGLKETRAVELRKTVGLKDFPRNFKKIIKTRESWPAVFVVIATLSFVISYLALSPIILIQQLGLTPIEFGTLFSLNSALIMVVSLAVPLGNRLFGAHNIITLGIGFVIMGAFLLLAISFIPLTASWQFMAPIAIACTGFALIYGNAEGIAISPHGERAGIAIGILGTIKSTLSVTIAILIVITYNGTTQIYGASFVILMTLALFYWKKSHLGKKNAELYLKSSAQKI